MLLAGPVDDHLAVAGDGEFHGSITTARRQQPVATAPPTMSLRSNTWVSSPARPS